MLGFQTKSTFYSGSKKYNTFTIESVGGLLGTDTLAQFPCIQECATQRFYAQIGMTDIVFFTKSTLLNLCDFAEKRGATELIFILDR